MLRPLLQKFHRIGLSRHSLNFYISSSDSDADILNPHIGKIFSRHLPHLTREAFAQVSMYVLCAIELALIPGDRMSEVHKSCSQQPCSASCLRFHLLSQFISYLVFFICCLLPFGFVNNAARNIGVPIPVCLSPSFHFFWVYGQKSSDCFWIIKTLDSEVIAIRQLYFPTNSSLFVS